MALFLIVEVYKISLTKVKTLVQARKSLSGSDLLPADPRQGTTRYRSATPQTTNPAGAGPASARNRLLFDFAPYKPN